MIKRLRPLLGVSLLVPVLGLAADPLVSAGDTRLGSAAKIQAEGGAGGDGAKPIDTGAGLSADGKGPPAPCAKPAVDPVDAKLASEAATAYLTALRDSGIGAAPAHLHPLAMERFKTLVMPALDAERARGRRGLLNATFGRDATQADAAAASPADFLARFVRLISAREPDAAPRFTTLAPLGLVPEGERLHVLVRLGSGAGGEGAERIRVVSLLPLDQGWKVLLDSRLEDMALALAGRSSPDERRPSLPRLEPIPEGVPLTPAIPQGPADLPTVPRP